MSELANHIASTTRLAKSRVFYTNARTLFKKNNVVFKEKGAGFSVCRKSPGYDYYLELDLGVFSAPFINEMLLMEVQGVNVFPQGFNKSHPSQYRGKLAEFSPAYLASLAEGFAPDHADEGALDIFLSDEVVTTGANNIYRVESKDIKTISRNDFESNGEIDFSDEADEEDSETEGDSNVLSVSIKDPKLVQPFYYVVTMERKGRMLKVLPRAWREKMENDGLSWEFDAKSSRLYVSNTLGASYGFPPPPKHLCGLPTLGLSLEDWDGATSDKEDMQEATGTTTPVAAGPRCGPEGSEWEKITERFIKDPCLLTFDNFRNAECIFAAYEAHKGTPGYKMGTNKNPLSQHVRKAMRGPDNAISWTEFVTVLTSIARPNDLKGITLLLFKLRLLVEQTRDGRVYVNK